MNIVCADSVFRGEEAFATLGDVTRLPETRLSRADLLETDILITRSKTRINRALLEGTPVRFVGCAVAGKDHIDTAYLEDAGIAWCHAPGCNANSVAEYVVTALLMEAERHRLDIGQLTLGIIGVGHIGTRVAEKAMAMGLTTLLNDPPRQAAGDRPHDPFIDLEDLCPAADVITVHVPLTVDGPYPTAQLLDRRFFARCAPGTLLIQASRGEVTDEEALREALDRGILRQAVLDVWENEPAVSMDLLARVDIGTPHIAGYSLEGRLNGTRMVYEECCQFLEAEPVWLESEEPAPENEYAWDVSGMSDQALWTALATTAYPLREDDRRFREGASADPEQMAQHFVKCRRTYPERREFAAARFALSHASEAALTSAWKLGFTICA